MNYLLDTNILLRLIETSSPQHQETVHAVKKVLTDQDDLYLIYESLIEFWVVATRAVTSNGLGLSTSVADHHKFSRHIHPIATIFTV